MYQLILFLSLLLFSSNVFASGGSILFILTVPIIIHILSFIILMASLKIKKYQSKLMFIWVIFLFLTLYCFSNLSVLYMSLITLTNFSFFIALLIFRRKT
jgi:hypothetical protein